MVSCYLNNLPTDTNMVDVVREIYESDCSAIQIAKMKVIAEHSYYISGDTDILMEGLSDFGRSIAEWFRNMIEVIKKFFTKFIKIFTDFSLNLKDYVDKNRDDLLASKINTTINGYNFTVINSPTPDMKEMDKLIGSYNTIVNQLDTIELADIRRDSAEFLSMTNLEKLRGEVLGSKGGIEDGIFLAYVRKFYRDGSESTTEVKVDSSYIREIVSHAGQLVDAKVKAVADRDRILKLLKSAETFFNSKISINYDKKSPTIKTKSISSDMSSDKFGVENGDTVSYESYYKKYSSLMNAKYNETKELAKIINVVVTERANAFMDQVKQERKIVAMAMKPMPRVTNESTDASFTNDLEEWSIGNTVQAYDEVEEATDYGRIGSEIDFLNTPIVENTELRNLCREAIWYHAAMENGNYDQVAMEGVIDSLANTLQSFILKITGLFKGNAKKLSNKYTPWFDDEGVIDALKSNAKKMSLDLIDHWSADYRGDLTQIEDVFNRVFQEPNDPARCDFAAQFLKETDVEKIKAFKDNNRDMVNVMKNYFRCGKPGIDKLEKVTIAGSALEKRIDSMIAYVKDFSKFSETLVTLDVKAKNLKVPAEESLSLWLDSYLSIEGCTVAESALGMILPTIPGFNYVMEADAPASSGTTTPTPSAGASDARKAASDAASKSGTDEKKTVDATKVVNNENDEMKKVAGDTGKTPDAKKAYYSFTCDFAKKLVSSYCTVCEERAVLYINVLKSCAGPEYKPVFRNGEYVKKSIRVKEEGRVVEVDGEKANKTTKEKVQSGAKKVLNKVSSTFKKKSGGGEAAVQNSLDLNPVYEKPTIGLNWMD